MKEIIGHVVLWSMYIMLISTFVLSLPTYTQVRTTVNDVNGDGEVNLTDLSVLAIYV